MKTTDLISIRTICTHYNIPISFINSLNEFDLIEVVETENSLFIYKTQIKDVEKIIRMHYELDINMEGIDVIYNLLKQVESLKSDINHLNNRLRFYENL